MKRRLLFTDLDGTLLDHESYEFAPAQPALRKLRELQIPVVLCSSKTAAEMIPLRDRLEIADPFIVENGGGIYFPADHPAAGGARFQPREEFLVLPLGRPAEELARFLREFSRQRHLAIRSFLDYSSSELAAETGLSEEEAERARHREFDVPFVPPRADQTGELEAAARERGFRVTRGGRFWHLTGQVDKGRAAAETAQIYQSFWGARPRLIGLGDSLNDLPMLQAVDCPIVVPNPGSTASLGERIPWARRAPEPGPAGWNRAVLELLEG